MTTFSFNHPDDPSKTYIWEVGSGKLTVPGQPDQLISDNDHLGIFFYDLLAFQEWLHRIGKRSISSQVSKPRECRNLLFKKLHIFGMEEREKFIKTNRGIGYVWLPIVKKTEETPLESPRLLSANASDNTYQLITSAPSNLDHEALLRQLSSSLASKNLVLGERLIEWSAIVSQSAEWNPIQLIFGEPNAEDDLYQPISFTKIKMTDQVFKPSHGDMTEYQRPWSLTLEDKASISARSLLTMPETWSILLGIPGSGKTSVLKWFLQLVIKGEISDFQHAIFISLGQFDRHLADFPDSDIWTAFFYEAFGLSTRDAAILGRQLAQSVGADGQSVLFLLDGLDEVPAGRRPLILNKIKKSLRKQRVIITSRPSSVDTLSTLTGVGYYEIVPLSPSQIRRLIVTYCATRQLHLTAAEILNILSNNASLHSFVFTPFMLMNVCEILDNLENAAHQIPFTQTWMFKQLVFLIQTEHNRRSERRLNESDLDVIAKFAYSLSFDSQGKQSRGSAPSSIRESDSIVQSRFLNENGFSRGVFEFTHLRLQEFFGAKKLKQLDSKHIQQFIEEQAFLLDWQEEVCFLAGLTKDRSPEEEPWVSLRRMLPRIRTERTGNGWFFLGSMVAPNLKDGGLRHVGVDVFEVLLDLILHDHYLKRNFAIILLMADWNRFIEQLWQKDPGGTVLRDIYSLIPPAIHKTKAWRDWVKGRPELNWLQRPAGVGFASEEMLAECRKKVADPTQPKKDRRQAIKVLGQAADDFCIDLLKPHLEEKTELSAQAILALSQIGGLAAAGLLAKALVSAPPGINLISLASALMIQHSGALEPYSRDLLIDWLIDQQEPYPDHTRFVLLALSDARLPSRGEEKICQFLLEDMLDPELKKAAFPLISSIQNDDLIGKLLKKCFETPYLDWKRNILGSIDHIPHGDPSFTNEVMDFLETSLVNNKEIYWRILAQSFSRFPNNRLFSMVPNRFSRFMEQLDFNVQDKDLIKTLVNLWQTAKHCGSDALNDLAWEKIAQSDVGLSVTSGILNYLESQELKPNQKQLEAVQERLISDQNNRIVSDILKYLCKSGPLNGSELLDFVESQMPGNTRRIAIRTVIETNGNLGHMIFTTQGTP